MGPGLADAFFQESVMYMKWERQTGEKAWERDRWKGNLRPARPVGWADEGQSGEGKTGLGVLGDVEWGRGLGQVREPGLPTSHLVPCHSVHHVHLTEEKRWRSWAHDSHGLRDHQGGTKVPRGLYLPPSCTTSWKNNSLGLPPPGGAQVQPVLYSL